MHIDDTLTPIMIIFRLIHKGFGGPEPLILALSVLSRVWSSKIIQILKFSKSTHLDVQWPIINHETTKATKTSSDMVFFRGNKGDIWIS